MPNEKTSKISDVELLNHYANEWSMLNQYVNDLDRGYEKFLTLMALIAGGAITLLAFIADGQHDNYSFIFYIVPLSFLAVFGVLGYQFRTTAILRGHLARVEEEMNKLLSKDVYIWNSSLIEVYMAHQNIPNNFLMVPIMLFIVGVVAVCIYQTWFAGDLWFNITYWTIVLVVATVVLIPFFRNEIFRHRAYDTDKIIQAYENYKTDYEEKKKLK
ncbi:MAG: hypothetical protein E7550_05670 [Ruminococcaceae bacterium]|nr:hypothetical protein [Oscillospiraceae bacterium]